MMYRHGDYVYPADLPRRFVCRVAAAQSFDVGRGTSQILKLEPLTGPWPAGTQLVRLDAQVRRAGKPRRRERLVPERAHPAPEIRRAFRVTNAMIETCGLTPTQVGKRLASAT